eukprot:2616630-Amphidinium_carterae.1
MKLIYLMHLEKVKPDDMSLVLPQASRGCALSGRSTDTSFAGSRAFVTVTRCSEESGKTFASLASQIIYDGKTTKSIIPGPRDELNIAAVNESHFSTTDSLFQLVGCLQNQVKDEGKFICMLDCAPTHTSASFRKKQTSEGLLYTAVEIDVMRPWKALARTSAGRQWAESVLACADPMGLVKSKPILRLNLQDLVASTSKAVGACRENREQAWQFLQLPSTMAEWQAMVDEADVLNKAGYLFTYSVLEGE